MAKLSTNQAREEGRNIVVSSKEGIKTGDLISQISAMSPETPWDTIWGAIRYLHKDYPQEISKPTRGRYVPVNATAIGPPAEVEPAAKSAYVKEEPFYEPFARFLTEDLGEVTDAVALGGASKGVKWGTPDVLGVYKAGKYDIVQFKEEIVSVEIKTNPNEPVTAFGQAVAYRLFSTKTYIAMPAIMKPDDKERLEALCTLFGVGLVFFDLVPSKPNWQIRVSSQKFNPDMFYVNLFAENLKQSHPDKFKQVFG
jgi:hypothetical protein